MSITQPPVENELTKERVLEAVSGVQEPAIGRGLVELRMIPAVELPVAGRPERLAQSSGCDRHDAKV